MRCLLLCLALALALSPAPAYAEARQDLAALRAAAARFMAERAGAAYPDSQARVEIGALDERLNLSRCTDPVFTPAAGATPWGAGTLKVSCPPPAEWTFYLTYRVSLKGPALLARHPMPARYAPVAGDVVKGEIEYSDDPGRYPRDPSSLRGAALLKPVAKGAPITIDMLRLQPIIRAGQRVRIRIEGAGFEVSQEGVAQAQAGVGDSLRLKVQSGRYVQGIVQPDGTVRVRP